jgi:hypothetical protein
MLQITRLERAAVESRPAPADWRLHHRLAFVGAVLLVIGLATAGGISWTTPVPPRPMTSAELRHQAESLTLQASVEEWVALMRGLDRRPLFAEKAYREAVESARRWLYVAAAITLAGLATIGAGFIARKCGTQNRNRAIG